MKPDTASTILRDSPDQFDDELPPERPEDYPPHPRFLNPDPDTTRDYVTTTTADRPSRTSEGIHRSCWEIHRYEYPSNANEEWILTHQRLHSTEPCPDTGLYRTLHFLFADYTYRYFSVKKNREIERVYIKRLVAESLQLSTSRDWPPYHMTTEVENYTRIATRYGARLLRQDFRTIDEIPLDRRVGTPIYGVEATEIPVKIETPIIKARKRRGSGDE